MKDLDIAEVVQHSGLPASTLRFYEEKGLIASVGRRGLRRLFDADVVERLALIALGRAAGFSIDEMARMFTPKGRPRFDRQKLVAKADELDKTIRELSAMRDGLRHAAACRAPSHMECATFRRILKAAASEPWAREERRPAGERIRAINQLPPGPFLRRARATARPSRPSRAMRGLRLTDRRRGIENVHGVAHRGAIAEAACDGALNVREVIEVHTEKSYAYRPSTSVELTSTENRTPSVAKEPFSQRSRGN